MHFYPLNICYSALSITYHYLLTHIAVIQALIALLGFLVTNNRNHLLANLSRKAIYWKDIVWRSQNQYEC